MKKMKFQVTGMVCNGCENRVQNALKQIEGVEKVTASHQKGTVTVQSKTDIDARILLDAIENLGYTVHKAE